VVCGVLRQPGEGAAGEDKVDVRASEGTGIDGDVLHRLCGWE
jgi:hypothetical protein